MDVTVASTKDRSRHISLAVEIKATLGPEVLNRAGLEGCLMPLFPKSFILILVSISSH